MRAPVAAAVMLLAVSCGPAEDGDAEDAFVGLSVEDASPSLTVAGGDRLFALRYCPPRPAGADAAEEAEEPARFPVSDLRVEIVARHVQYASIWSLRYELLADQDGDHRFGPDDVLLVSERERDLFAPMDSGSYRVRLFCGSRLLGAGEWMAR